MITNEYVTVYNRVSGDFTDYDTWIRTVLHDVYVHVDHKTAVTDNGRKVQRFTDRDPRGIRKQAVSSAGSVRLLWRLWILDHTEDDQIVLEERQIAIERPADLKAVFQKHCKVTSWSDNRFGTTPHWRIGGE